MYYIEQAITEEWPSGKASAVMKAMDARYQPNDHVTRHDAKDKLRSIKLGKLKNPEIFFMKLMACYNQYRHLGHLTEEDVIDQIVTQAHPIYENGILELQEKGGATVKDYRTKMSKVYRLHQITTRAGKTKEGDEESMDEDDTDEEGQEKALHVYDGDTNPRENGESKLCMKCKRVGHRAFECPYKNDVKSPDSNNSKGKKFNSNFKSNMHSNKKRTKGTCHNCVNADIISQIVGN
jgi:hypothetical protein